MEKMGEWKEIKEGVLLADFPLHTQESSLS